METIRLNKIRGSRPVLAVRARTTIMAQKAFGFQLHKQENPSKSQLNLKFKQNQLEIHLTNQFSLKADKS